MRIMNKKDKEYLLQLARRSIQKYLQNQKMLKIEEDKLPQTLKEKRGIFVSLWKNQELRGCIGNLEGDKPIYQSIIDNSLASAFLDPRFAALQENELNDIKIEISVLSELKKLPDFASPEHFLDYLNKHRPGLFILRQKPEKKATFQATFLPQVWEDLKTAETFISRLCKKAGLDEDEWKKMDLEVYGYKAEVFKEE